MAELARFPLLIDGRLEFGEEERFFQSVNPATGEPWAQIPQASARDTERAVTAAHKAFISGSWSGLLPIERAKTLRRFADLLRENSEELARIETLDTGKLLKETRFQARYVADYYEYFAGLADKVEGRTLPLDKPGLMAFTLREPLGVVAAIVPWNSQLMLSTLKMGPALAAGNTLVVKASEHASATMLELGKLVLAAGFPTGVVNILSGFADPVGRILTSHRDIARISFTGGVETARRVVVNSAENLAQVSLELGGKSPVIVFADADFETAINGVMAGIFGAAGQSCVAGSRLYVHSDIADRFLGELVRRAARIKIGDPLADDTEMGPLATEAQFMRVEKMVLEAEQSGARIWCGGRRPKSHRTAWYFEPTVVECATNDLGIVHCELFGPVLSVVRFSDEQSVVQMANASAYGLAAGVFTTDVARALRMSRAIRSGIVWINTYRVVSPSAEFGGFKDSGYSREGGTQSIYDYTRAKTVWISTSSAPMGSPFVMR